MNINGKYQYSNWIPLFIGLITRIVNLNSPIVGVHSWRQADTAAMARHFYLQQSPIWLPQVDWGGASKGFVESEFPIYPYLVAQVYKITGLNESYGRLLSVFFGVLTIYLIIRIGTIIFNPSSGWWGGLFFSILPINIYYSRTFQAESLLLLLAAISIERLISWNINKTKFSLIISWISFVLACLLKILPFVWLGLPLLGIQMTYSYKITKFDLIKLPASILFNRKSLGLYLYIITALLVVSSWFIYSYRLGQSSGISFFLWGKDTDRISLSMIFNLKVWLDLILRISLRNLALIGLPFLILGIFKSKQYKDSVILNLGLLGVFITTILSIRSSSVHEYYQLPMQIFACPLVGLGWCSVSGYIRDNLKNIMLLLMIFISSIIMIFDYWSLENVQAKLWMPLAESVRKEVPLESRVVSVTGLDPTLLNLSRRQGWLASPYNVNEITIKEWKKEGAKVIIGNINWQENYIPLEDQNIKTRLEKYLCSDENKKLCNEFPDGNYIIPIRNLDN